MLLHGSVAIRLVRFMWASCSPSTSSSAVCKHPLIPLGSQKCQNMQRIRVQDLGGLTSEKEEGVPLDLQNITTIRMRKVRRKRRLPSERCRFPFTPSKDMGRWLPVRSFPPRFPETVAYHLGPPALLQAHVIQNLWIGRESNLPRSLARRVQRQITCQVCAAWIIKCALHGKATVAKGA